MLSPQELHPPPRASQRLARLGAAVCALGLGGPLSREFGIAKADLSGLQVAWEVMLTTWVDSHASLTSMGTAAVPEITWIGEFSSLQTHL